MPTKEKSRSRRYGKAAGKRVASAMRRKKHGTLRSGKGGKVKSRKQAIAIGLSEARKKGCEGPTKKILVRRSRPKRNGRIMESPGSLAPAGSFVGTLGCLGVSDG